VLIHSLVISVAKAKKAEVEAMPHLRRSMMIVLHALTVGESSMILQHRDIYLIVRIRPKNQL
jgi:hypothetical protein